MNYYNEWDKGAAAWLRELIKNKLIPYGYVDERSITEVTPSDLEGFTQCHFFAGIGGWPLALQLAGVPESTQLWTGSPPCQPFSVAGQSRGFDDERHLAPAFLRLIRECKPKLLFGEQVAAAIGKHWLDFVFLNLEEKGYTCGAAVLPACSVGAPHKRERLFFGAHQLADTSSSRYLHSESTTSETGRKPEYESAGKLSTRPGGRAISSIQQSAGMGGMAESLCAEWDGERLHGLGEGNKAQGSRTAAESTGLSDSCCMVDADSERLQMERGDSDSQGWEGQNIRPTGLLHGAGVEYNTTNPHHSFWSDADWLGCRDGKFRPVEPGTQPLAHGVPARVGRLRDEDLQSNPQKNRAMRLSGYGNAIVPQVAAEFVKAFMGY